MAAAHVAGVAAMVIASGVLGSNPVARRGRMPAEGDGPQRPSELGQLYDPQPVRSGLIDAAAAVSARAPGC